MTKTIGVVSLKGGVGKTSVVVSLGSALSQLGKKVLLVDGNLSSPSLGLHLNVFEPEKTLHHVLSRSVNIKDSIYTREGLDLIPSSVFGDFSVSPMQLKDKIKNIKNKYDFILIDSSPSLDEETLAVILASDEIFVVTTSDHPTLSATLKSVKLARQRGIPISGLILNKFQNKDFEVSFEDVESIINLPIMAVIPYDVGFLKALSNMESYISYKPNSKASIEYKKLASVLTGEKYKQTRLQDFLRKLTPSRQDINREIFYTRIFKE